MLEKPALTDETIAACLHEGYGIAPRQIEFLPLGQDNNAWVYRVDAADGAAHFLKVRRPPAHELSLVLPRYLRDTGFELVVAPLPTYDGNLWQAADEYVLMLYPYIDARPGKEAGLSLGQ